MLKVLQVNQTLDVFNGTSNKGKPYSIYSWFANVNVDGQGLQGVKIKSFEPITFPTDEEFQFKRDEYHNPKTGEVSISYMLTSTKKQEGKKPWQSSRPTYTLAEYDNLWLHAMKKFANTTENKQEYISTYIISACQAGVKVSTEKIEKQIDQEVKKLDAVIDPDDGIPF
jgi:hypothetical protein